MWLTLYFYQSMMVYKENLAEKKGLERKSDLLHILLKMENQEIFQHGGEEEISNLRKEMAGKAI